MKGCRSYDPSKILKWCLFVEGTLSSNVGTLIFQCMTCKMIISYLAVNEGAKIATKTKILATPYYRQILDRRMLCVDNLALLRIYQLTSIKSDYLFELG